MALCSEIIICCTLREDHHWHKAEEDKVKPNPYVPTGKPRGRPPTKQPLSKDLSQLLGVDKDVQMSEKDVVKGVWAYVKENELQDSGHWFTPDKKMQAIFGKEKVARLGMNKFLKTHMG